MLKIGAPSWRALGLGAMLVVALFVSALLADLDHHLRLGQWGGAAAVLGGGAFFVALAVLSTMAVRHKLGTAGAAFLSSHAAALTAMGSLALALHLALPFFGQEPLFGVHSVLVEAVAGYWRTMAVLFGAVLFTWLYPGARGVVDSLVAVPVFMWGVDATRSHWVALSAHSHSLTFHLQMLWFGFLVGSLVLVGVLAAACIWRRACGLAPVRLSARAPLALTVLVVYTDWAFSLYVISMMGSGAWATA